MWQHNYTPLAGSLGFSALVAALPIFVLLYLLGVKRKPAWVAALSGLVAAAAVALLVYRMPAGAMIGAVGYGAAFGLFPIGWVVFCAILLYRITLETGKFEIVKDSVGSLTDDRRLQALLIAFAFGAFIEGAAGFGTPVAVSAAMLTGLGFSPFYAAGICLLANTAPVAFGSIGTPILALSTVTFLPKEALSAWVGRICAPISLIVPAYLLAVMGGWRALKGVLLGAVVCGVSFSATQVLVSNFIGPELTDILSSLAALGSLVLLFLLWKPKDKFDLEGHSAPPVVAKRHPAGELLLAWAPYLILVGMVLVWGFYKTELSKVSLVFPWPGLDKQILQMPPVTAKPAPYSAVYRFDWLSASGTACLIASLLSALLLRMSLAQFFKVLATTTKQLALSMLTIASVLALAFLMNYCGATATMGLAFAATGVLFPFFSSLLGWLGVFLTGSDTSANALFGNLQVVTAGRLGLDPVLMAASNSSGGVMGKMISLQSIAVAAAATGMKSEDEAKLFRFTLRHSIILASVIGLITMLYSALTR
ncbi:MAG: lactate permease LctP family transporter [Acidobacteria bacterium]|nr:lactate permease LctP family transporter [Acidobacteriota bacterium]